MADQEDPFTDVAEFDDDATYSWWLNAHPDGFVLALRAKHPALLHRARCREVDRDRHPGRFTSKNRRYLCAEMKSALRAWVQREIPDAPQLLARCPKCEP